MKSVLEKAQATLGQALSKLFEQADDTLFDLANPGQGANSATFFEGFREMRLRRQSVERIFKQELASAFSDWEVASAESSVPGDEVAPSEPPAVGLGELSLVSDDQFEEDLAIDAMVKHADVLVKSERPALERRLAAMRGGSEKETVINPISPSTVAASFRAAMAECEDVALPVRLVVYKLFDRQVMVRLPELYHQVNHDLAAAGILPELSMPAPSVARTPQPPVLGGEPAEISLFGDAVPPPTEGLDMAGLPTEPVLPAGLSSTTSVAGAPVQAESQIPMGGVAPPAGRVAGAGTSSPQDVMGLLHSMIARLQGIGGSAGAGVAVTAAHSADHLPAHLVLSPPGGLMSPVAPVQAPVYTDTQLLAALGRLRAQMPASSPSASHNEGAASQGMDDGAKLLDVRALLPGLLASLAPSQPGAAKARISSEHEVAIEMISMLFDFISEDHALSADMRAYLGRLQLPYLRAAIHDPDLFAEEDHPARVLLDQMAEAGKGCPEHDHSPMAQLIESTVDHICDAPDEDHGVFGRQLDEFRAQSEQIRQRTDRIAARAQQALSARERREAVRRQVAEELIEQLDRAPRLPVALREVIMRAWAHNLVMLRLRFGEDSPQQRRSDRVVSFIVGVCVQEPLSEPNRRAFEQQRPEILQIWREGLFYTGLHEADVRILEVRLGSLMDEMLDPLAVAAQQRSRNQSTLFGSSQPSASSADSPELMLSRIPHPSILEALEPSEQVELSEAATRPMPSSSAVSDADGVARDDEAGPSASAVHQSPGDTAPHHDEKREEAAGEAVPAPSSNLPTPSQTPVEIAMSMQKGQWIELRQEEQSPRRLRLSWVSGMTGRLLFINAYGQGNWDTTREEVANRIASGELMLVESGEMVDRAMVSIKERLKKKLSRLIGGGEPQKGNLDG